MKTKLDLIRGQQVTAFCSSLSGATLTIHGILIGGDLPGRPYGVICGETNSRYNNSSLSFTLDNIVSIELRRDQNIINLK
jgi:hypothetical protein